VGIVVMTNSTRSYRFHELLHRLARGSWGHRCRRRARDLRRWPVW